MHGSNFRIPPRGARAWAQRVPGAGDGRARAEGKMKKYKVIITKETYVEADNEDDAELQAYDSLICSDVDFDTEEIKND